MDGHAKTPALNNLFDVRKESPYLKKNDQEFFHSTVARLLFLCKRGRPNIQIAVAFLCTQVQKSQQDDKDKLRSMIHYLRSTSDLTLKLWDDNLNTMKWWVDAAFAVHDDMKSHTGGAMSMGLGAAFGTSRKT